MKMVPSRQHAFANIQRFAKALDESPALQGRLAYARSWYAYQDDTGSWLLGPSKFIGYDGLDAETYIATAEDLNGRRTEAQLKQWFTVVDPSSALYDELNSELLTFVSQYGKAPSTKMRISIPNDVHSDEEKDADANAEIVDLIIAVAKSLPTAAKAQICAALKA